MENKRRILLVDDEVEITEIMQQMLQAPGLEHFDITIDTAHDGSKGLELLMSKTYDLAFFDLRMPGLGGEDLVKNIRRSQSVNRDIPIVVVSGYIPEIAEEALRAEGTYFVDKPFSQDKIVRLAKIWLSRTAA